MTSNTTRGASAPACTTAATPATTNPPIPPNWRDYFHQLREQRVRTRYVALTCVNAACAALKRLNEQADAPTPTQAQEVHTKLRLAVEATAVAVELWRGNLRGQVARLTAMAVVATADDLLERRRTASHLLNDLNDITAELCDRIERDEHRMDADLDAGAVGNGPDKTYSRVIAGGAP